MKKLIIWSFFIMTIITAILVRNIILGIKTAIHPVTYTTESTSSISAEEAQKLTHSATDPSKNYNRHIKTVNKITGNYVSWIIKKDTVLNEVTY